MANRAASGGSQMSVQHAMDAAEVRVDLDDDEQDGEMQRHAAMARGLEDGVELRLLATAVLLVLGKVLLERTLLLDLVLQVGPPRVGTRLVRRTVKVC